MSLLERIGIAFAKQWIAGVDERDAINAGKEINLRGEKVILNYLGENFRDKKSVQKSVKIYLNLLRHMKLEKIAGSISIKPSQLGILISDNEFYQNYKMIVAHAKKLGFDVWVDAEEYQYIERTHKVVLRILKDYKNTGVGIQTSLKRSMDDAARIARSGGLVRLVKGAYSEPSSRAYGGREEVRANYIAIMEMLFRRKARFMVATHDDYLIYKAVEAQKKYRRKVAFGMLKGIRGKLAAQLVRQGEDVNIYVPFGDEWMSYSKRRLQEGGHAMLLLRSIFQQ